MIRPFLDHDIQFRPGSTVSPRSRLRIALGTSAPAGFAILQTRKSPLAICTASISDLCFEFDACQAKPTIGDGVTDVDRVCKIVKEGKRDAIRIDPLLYLFFDEYHESEPFGILLPYGKRLAICTGGDCRNRIVDSPGRLVLLC